MKVVGIVNGRLFIGKEVDDVKWKPERPEKFPQAGQNFPGVL